MRKIWVILLAMMLVTATAYAEDTLADRAVTLVQTCDALAGDESYCSAMTASSGAIGEKLKAWAEGDHDQPRIIMHADTSDIAGMIASLYGNDEATLLSETAIAVLGKKYPANLPSMLNAASGAETLAAATIATTDMIFASDEQGSGMFILLYNGAVPAAVTWYAENGAVSMQGCFLAVDALNECQTAEQVSAVLAEHDIELVFEMVAQ